MSILFFEKKKVSNFMFRIVLGKFIDLRRNLNYLIDNIRKQSKRKMKSIYNRFYVIGKSEK